MFSTSCPLYYFHFLFLCTHTAERPADILGLELGAGLLAVPGNPDVHNNLTYPLRTFVITHLQLLPKYQWF